MISERPIVAENVNRYRDLSGAMLLLTISSKCEFLQIFL